MGLDAHRKRLAWTLLAYLVAVVALLVPECARAEEPCVREGGRVCCEVGAFTTLTDTIVELQTALDRCKLDKEIPPPPPPAPICPVAELPPLPAPRSAVRPVAGLATGVASTVLLVVSVVTPLPMEVRAGLGTLALGGLGTSVFLVLP